MASGRSQQRERAGRDEEAKPARPAPDPASGTEHPQVRPRRDALRCAAMTLISLCPQVECVGDVLIARTQPDLDF